MPPRPIYKWKSFWLGIILIGMLAWAWWHSYRMGAGVSISWGKEAVVIMHGKGESVLGIIPGGTAASFEYAAHPSLTTQILEAWRQLGWRNHIHIPDAAVFTACLLLWLAFLAWRWQRLKKRQAPDRTNPSGLAS